MTVDSGTQEWVAKTQAKTVVLGVVFGIDAIGHCVALATLAFSGPLSFALGYGTMLILLSSALIAIILAAKSVFAGAAGIAEDTTIAILAPAMVLAASAVEGSAEEKLATAVAIMGISTFLSGVLIFAVGQLGLGRLARYIPFPVAAGFLAGSGWLLLSSGLFLLTGTETLPDLVMQTLSGHVPLNLILGVLLAGVLLLSPRVLHGPWAVIVPILLALALFYAVLAMRGIPIELVREAGLLPELPGEVLGGLPEFGLLKHVDWSVTASASITILVIVLLNGLGFVLNTTGIELAVGDDISLDAEARTVGASNILIGAFGGLLGYTASDSTIFAHKLGCNTRVLGFALGATTLLAFAFAAEIVGYVPVFAATALVLYFGVVMLTDWMFALRSRLPMRDWLVIPIIVVTTIFAGIVAAVVVGFIAALLLFVYTYSRLPVISFDGELSDRRSNVDRSRAEDAILKEYGPRTRILALQGYLFFGSIEGLLDRVRSATSGPNRIETFAIDFSKVTGLDSAACAGLIKFGNLAASQGFVVVFAGISEDVMKQMNRWGLDFENDQWIGNFPNLNSALETVEDYIIRRHAAEQDGSGPSRGGRDFLSNLPRAGELIGHMERLDAAPGDVLIAAGSANKDIFFIENGRVTILVDGPSGAPVRVRSMRSGAVIGEAARYLDSARTANVVVDEPSVIYRFSDEALTALEREEPELAAIFHSFMARGLAEKVQRMNQQLIAALR